MFLGCVLNIAAFSRTDAASWFFFWLPSTADGYGGPSACCTVLVWFQPNRAAFEA